MGKNLDAARVYLAKEAEAKSLLKQLRAKGWNIIPIAFVDITVGSYSLYVSFLKRLLESEEVINIGEVQIVFISDTGCRVKGGVFYIGIETPIDEILQFLKE
ncbi:MAG TPA: hypothetical protein VJB56_02695 [Candidatus Paceibacterota bacterium]